MMYGLNTHPIAPQITHTTAVVSTLSVPENKFFNRPRVSYKNNQPDFSYTARPNELMIWYDKGDAVDVMVKVYIHCLPDPPTQEATAADARWRFWVEDGHVYAQILEGRDNEITKVTAWIRHESGEITAHTTVVHIKLRLPYP